MKFIFKSYWEVVITFIGDHAIEMNLKFCIEMTRCLLKRNLNSLKYFTEIIKIFE